MKNLFSLSFPFLPHPNGGSPAGRLWWSCMRDFFTPWWTPTLIPPGAWGQPDCGWPYCGPAGGVAAMGSESGRMSAAPLPDRGCFLCASRWPLHSALPGLCAGGHRAAVAQGFPLHCGMLVSIPGMRAVWMAWRGRSIVPPHQLDTCAVNSWMEYTHWRKPYTWRNDVTRHPAICIKCWALQWTERCYRPAT